MKHKVTERFVGLLSNHKIMFVDVHVEYRYIELMFYLLVFKAEIYIEINWTKILNFWRMSFFETLTNTYSLPLREHSILH